MSITPSESKYHIHLNSQEQQNLPHIQDPFGTINDNFFRSSSKHLKQIEPQIKCKSNRNSRRVTPTKKQISKSRYINDPLYSIFAGAATTTNQSRCKEINFKGENSNYQDHKRKDESYKGPIKLPIINHEKGNILPSSKTSKKIFLKCSQNGLEHEEKLQKNKNESYHFVHNKHHSYKVCFKRNNISHNGSKDLSCLSTRQTNENKKNAESGQNNQRMNQIKNLYMTQKFRLELESPEVPEYYRSGSFLFKEFAYSENSNPKNRDYMEDRGKSVMNFNNNPDNALFCLFDGHGGSEVSSYLQSTFVNEFKKIIPLEDYEYEFTELFNEIDEKIKTFSYSHVGSTACIVYITKFNNKTFLYCANIGDTRCILISNKKVTRISFDDKAYDNDEYNRIIGSGGNVYDGRVQGKLNLSRTFGDWELKPYGVISNPHVKKVPIEETDKFVIIASDGVWDVFEDEDMFHFCTNYSPNGTAEDLCKDIIKEALDRGSMDNLSCFVIKL